MAAHTAQEAFAKLKPSTQAEHVAAWSRVSAAVTKLAARPGAKVFEVHHAVEHARKLYQAELAGFHAADHCERVVMRAYGLVD